ncbi:MAG: hypothetical protein AAF356_12720 [Planctomycetota bacterium]
MHGLALVDHPSVGGWALAALGEPRAGTALVLTSQRDARVKHVLRGIPGRVLVRGAVSLRLVLRHAPARAFDVELSDVPPADLLARLARSGARRVRVPGEVVAARVAPALPAGCALDDRLAGDLASCNTAAPPVLVPGLRAGESVVLGLADRPGDCDARQFAHLIGLMGAAGKPGVGIIPRGSIDLGVALSYQARLPGLFRVLTAEEPTPSLLRAADVAVIIRHPRDVRPGPETMLRAWVRAHGVALAEVTPVPPGHLRRAKSLALPVLEALGWNAATVPA